MEMDASEIELALRMLDDSLFHSKWRLKPSSKRRLQTDILALCTGMRPVVMVDYGGKMPELQGYLCGVVQYIQKVSSFFKQLHVMIVDDMIYMVNACEFAEYISWSISSEAKQAFVDLERDPPEMTAGGEKSLALQPIQKLFSSVFTVDGVNYTAVQSHHIYQKENANSSASSREVIDLTVCLKDSQVTIPSLNGWLLGYPVVYMFSKEHIDEAVHNLSTKSLCLFKVLVSRSFSAKTKNASHPEELMSFTVPYELSMEGRNEPWAESFWMGMKEKWSRCRSAWLSMQLEVSTSYPQAIVL